jgi:hypothetical protein
MTEHKEVNSSGQVYRSYDEFRKRFYGCEDTETERKGVSASFGRNLAKEIVDKASGKGKKHS